MLPKAIIIIGGGYLQLNLIRWAKNLGLSVIVTDKNEKLPCNDIFDEFVNVDGEDIDGFIKTISELSQKYNFVGCYSGSDFGLMTVSSISDFFGFPACDKQSVRLSLNKFESKQIWKKEGLPTPTGYAVSTLNELQKSLDFLNLPIILKPIDSSGSVGVYSVSNKNDIETYFNKSIKFSNPIIAEELISGKHIDVNGLFLENKFIKCGIFDRFFSKPPLNYPTWGYTPSSLSTNEENQIYSIVEKAARSLGIDVGPVKADVIVNDKSPYVIELAPRFHGDVSTSFILHTASGQNPIKTWFSYLAGDDDPLAYMKKTKKDSSGWMALFSTKSGVLKSVEGIDEAKLCTGIKDIFISVHEGQGLRLPKDNSDVCGFIWAVGIDGDDLFKKLSFASSKIEFIIEPSYKKLENDICYE